MEPSLAQQVTAGAGVGSAGAGVAREARVGPRGWAGLGAVGHSAREAEPFGGRVTTGVPRGPKKTPWIEVLSYWAESW